jgi:tripartite-type tricarboxylate transporter receptor subunit TctC
MHRQKAARFTKAVLFVCGLAAASLVRVPVDAAAWPTRPIRLIVPQAAGGAPDVIARILAAKLGEGLGQQVVVENRTGAGNVIGAQVAARAAPDGYTLLFAPAAALVTNPYTFEDLPYKPDMDFETVGLVARGPFVLLANPKLPVHDLNGLFAYDAQHPHQLSIAVDGPTFFSGMLAAWLDKLGHGSMVLVSYPHMPQGVEDALAGRVQLIILALPVAAQHIATGALKPLAISWTSRLPAYPDVPTMAETFPGVDVVGWFVVVAPRDTPAAIVQRVNAAMDGALKQPEVKAKLAALGFFTDGAETPAAASAYVKAQYDAWGKIVQAIGIAPK